MTNTQSLMIDNGSRVCQRQSTAICSIAATWRATVMITAGAEAKEKAATHAGAAGDDVHTGELDTPQYSASSPVVKPHGAANEECHEQNAAQRTTSPAGH